MMCSLRRVWLSGAALASALLLPPVPARAASPLSDARALIEIGAYAKATALLEGLRSIEAVTLRAEIELAHGDAARAVSLLTPVVPKTPKATDPPRPRLLLGRALIELGEKSRAETVLDPLADWYLAGHAKGPSALVDVAAALALTAHFKNANDVLAEAEEAARGTPAAVEVELAYGDLLLSKYNFRDADTAYKNAAKRDPHNARALLGLARVDLDSDGDPRSAAARADKVLQRNPHHVGALCMRAEIAIHNEDLETALAAVRKALAERPKGPEAHALLGVVALLADDEVTLAQAEKAALALNPKDARFYHVVAVHAERAHRYDRVNILLDKALALDPDYAPALAEAGIGYGRFGLDDKARETLERAADLDPYNVRVYNLLTTIYDRAFKRMDLLGTKHLELRLDRAEKDTLAPLLVPLLDDAWQTLGKRYGRAPDKPLRVEVFPSPEHFSVRTLGLPNLGAHGVCFGHLITVRSPSNGDFNWRMVFWHEMAHVWHIQMTGGRVPRWFTEGLAVLEAERLDPRYRMGLDRDLYDRMKRGALAPIARFNLAFTQARSFDDILGAYFQASLLVRHVDEAYGGEALVRMLRAWGDKRDTATVVRQVLGKAPERVDAEFKAWLTRRLARYDMDFRPDPARFADRAAFEAALLKRRGDPAALAEVGAARFVARDIKGAKEALDAAVKADPKQPLAQYFLMELATKTGNAASAQASAEALRSGGKDGVKIRQALAMGALPSRDFPSARKHLQTALGIDPTDVSSAAFLAEVCRKARDEACLIDAARRGIAVEPVPRRLGMLLSRAALWKRDPALAREAVAVLTQIVPFSPDLDLAKGRERLAAGDRTGGIVLIDKALEAGVKHDADEAWVDLGEARLAGGDKAGAAEAARKALEVESGSDEAKDLLVRATGAPGSKP